MKRTQAGFAIVEAVIIVVILAGLVGVGYVVMKRHANTAVTPGSSTATTATTAVPTAPQVKTTSDLNTAQKTLDATNVDASSNDTTQLDNLASGL